MLVFGRRQGETIIVDLRPFGLGLMTIANMGKNGNSTHIGVESDRRIEVHRKENFDKNEARRLEGGSARGVDGG